MVEPGFEPNLMPGISHRLEKLSAAQPGEAICLQQWGDVFGGAGFSLYDSEGFLRWLSDKESACVAGATGDLGSIPGSGRSPGEGNDNPLQYSFLANPTDRGDWWATVQGITRSQTLLEQQSRSTSLAQNRNDSFLRKSSLVSVT